ncbi:MAG: DUF2815 family protein [Erysipelotrichaceae bacterium]|nr:DUF2815 family protein [Erysipelotrichaceae bacterium]
MKNPATRVKTSEVRLSFCHLAEPYSYGNDDQQSPKYSVSMIISKSDSATIAAIRTNYNLAIEHGIEKYGEAFRKKATPLVRPEGSDQGLLIDCDKDERYQEDKDYKNCYILSAKSLTPAPVYAIETGKKQLTPDEIKELVYSGCYGKVLFNFYPYNNRRMGIACGLDSVLKTRDGESLGGRVNAMDYFGDDLNSAADSLLGSDDDLLG